MTTLQSKHLELVRSVNEAETHVQHRDALSKLTGFREALLMFDYRAYVEYLMDCDMHYIEQGVDRPMCCGVFLDWSQHNDTDFPNMDPPDSVPSAQRTVWER